MQFLNRVQKLYTVAKEMVTRRYYNGPDLESGKTSRNLPIGPWIHVLTDLLGDSSSCGPILDVGAGVTARVAKHLRELGYKVYAYDPNHGTSSGGFENGSSNVLPHGHFDFVISTFVLNVVKKSLQDEIIASYKRFSKKQIHVTRNMDIFETVAANLKKDGSNLVKDFYSKEFFSGEGSVNFSGLTKAEILDFCHFGVQTRDGFQRIPELELDSFHLVKKTNGWKVYKNF
jgi:hypothetical protein